ncbi:MAG: ferredoxin family protein [Candidatus Nitrosocaldaceae archaeon]
MSALLEDKVYVVLSETTKRGVYPLHGYKYGLYRLPVELTKKEEIDQVINALKSSFTVEKFADRILVTYKWKERDVISSKKEEWKEAELEITVEIVTCEVIDIIYQIKPLENFPEAYWVKNYRQKADHNAKMTIDVILRNTIIGQKLIEVWKKKLGEDDARVRLEGLTPLARTSVAITQTQTQAAATQASAAKVQTQAAATQASAKGIDPEFMKKLQVVTKSQHGYKIWGVYEPPTKLGIHGTAVAVDFDICIGDGACIEACPVNVYEWVETPNHPLSSKKAAPAREPDCIACLACENVCPPKAIKITPGAPR